MKFNRSETAINMTKYWIFPCICQIEEQDAATPTGAKIRAV